MDPTTLRSQLLAILNRDIDDTSLFAESIVLWAFEQGGPETPPSIYEGVEQVAAWLRRPIEKTFEFEAEPFEPIDHVEVLPQGEASYGARYRVVHLDIDWSNSGQWVLHVSKGQLVGWYHLPDALPHEGGLPPEEMVRMATRAREAWKAGQLADPHDHAHGHDHDHAHGHDHNHARDDSSE